MLQGVKFYTVKLVSKNKKVLHVFFWQETQVGNGYERKKRDRGIASCFRKESIFWRNLYTVRW
jgi:hypothetical protein